MPNPQNLRPKPFTSENQPVNRGRKKGTPNRATVFKRWLETKISVEDPTNDKKKVTVTLLEAAALGQIKSATEGNTNAWKEIQDTLHGKQTDTLNINVGELTDEQLQALASGKS